MLNAQQKGLAEDVVAEISFANGKSFNVTHSPQYREMIMKVIVAGPSFQPPSYNKMRTSLLDRWVLKMQGVVTGKTCLKNSYYLAVNYLKLWILGMSL